MSGWGSQMISRISALFIGLMCMLFTVPSLAQTIVYSENFIGGVGYSPGSSQWNNWISFRASLTGGYNFITVKGSLAPVGLTCTNPTTATQIANALNTGTTSSFSCDGNSWKVGTCGIGIELNVGTGTICTCNVGLSVRPTLQVSNPNWGGLGGTTCFAPSQTLTVELSVDTTLPVVTITNVPAITDGSTPFIATFTFSEDISGMSLADVTAALTNATATGLTETIANRRFIVTITPNGAGDVSVGLNSAAVQDAAGNGNAAATPQVAILFVPDPSLSVTVTANDTSDVVAGQVITYTYVVVNDGNQIISDISLSDVHGGSGTAPAPNADSAILTDTGTIGDSTNLTTGDGSWDVLAPGDILSVDALYTITQQDIDTLQ